MRFAHLADIHLGHRQYGLWERAVDYARAFTRAVDEVLSKRLPFAVIAGDLFDSRLPSAFAVRVAFRELGRIRSAGIPVYAVRGNHDAVEGTRGGNYLHLLADAGLIRYLETPERPYEDIAVGKERIRVLGFGCSPEAFLHGNLEVVSTAVDPTADYNILVLHQTFDRVEARDQSYPLPTAYFFDEAFKHIDYYAMGHVHELGLKHPDLPAYYAGSLETWDLQDAESIDLQMATGEVDKRPQRQKGFLVVDVQQGDVHVEPVTLPNRRAMHLQCCYGEVDPREASTQILDLSSKLNVDDAVVNISVSGVVKKGSRRSDLMLSEIRSALSRSLKLRVNNNLSYGEKGPLLQAKGQVGAETALYSYFLEELKNPELAEKRARAAIRVFHLLDQKEDEKAKEVLESAL